MHILQMIDTLCIGGAQQLLITFAKEAAKRGYQLTVVSLSEDDGSPNPARLRALGAAVYFFPSRRIFDLKNLARIAKFIHREKPDIIHAHLTYSHVIGAFTAFWSGVPVVSTIHSTGVDARFHAPRTEWLEGLVLRRLIKRVIACGPAVAEYYFQTVHQNPDFVIPNAVEDSSPRLSTEARDALRSQIAGDSSRLIVFSAGRIVEQKGFQDLLDAFAVARHSCPNAFLAIAGDGDYQAALEEKIKTLNLSDHIRLLGRRADVSSLMQASDMFALASHWEGLPISILEAMSAGLPVLTTRVGDTVWALGEAGVTVLPRQPEEFARAMSDLLCDSARRISLGQAARERIHNEFNPSRWFDELLEVYRSVLH